MFDLSFVTVGGPHEKVWFTVVNHRLASAGIKATIRQRIRQGIFEDAILESNDWSEVVAASAFLFNGGLVQTASAENAREFLNEHLATMDREPHGKRVPAWWKTACVDGTLSKHGWPDWR